MKQLLIIGLFLFSNNMPAQNLLQNADFEDYYGCPSGIGQFDSIKIWKSVLKSPDYFNCGAPTGKDLQSVPSRSGFAIHKTYTILASWEAINIESRLSRDQNDIYFLTITVVDWVDLFNRKDYSIIVVDSLKYCIENKGLVSALPR